MFREIRKDHTGVKEIYFNYFIFRGVDELLTKIVINKIINIVLQG